MERQNEEKNEEKKLIEDKNGLAAMVLSIISVFSIITPILGLILAVVAITYAKKQNRERKTTESKIGMIIASMSLIINTTLLIAMAISSIAIGIILP